MRFNRLTSYMGYRLSPLFAKAVYKEMRQREIRALPLKKFTELTGAPLNSCRLIAHRGLSGDNPENTAPAFEAAGRRGYYGIECDTYRSRDGVWVISHDPILDNIFNGTGRIIDRTCDELMQLRAVRGANVEKFPDLRICTLQTYVDICKKYGCLPVIEVKDARVGTMKSFYDFLVKNDLTQNAVIISFIAGNLKALHELDPSLTLWYLVNYIDRKHIRIAEACGCQGVDFSAAFNLCRPEWVRRLPKKGLSAACWTVDDRDSLCGLLAAGVEYMTTNSILPE